MLTTGKKYKPPKKEEIDSKIEDVVKYLKYNGLKEKAHVIEAAYIGSAELCNKLRKIVDEVPDKSNQMTPNDATALLLRAGLKKQQYEDIKSQSDAMGHHFLPNYHAIIDEKEKLLPENIFVSDEKASVPLRDMMKKTVDRHLEDPNFVTIVKRLEKKNNGKNVILEASYKSGFDVASSQKRYNVSNKISSIQFWHNPNVTFFPFFFQMSVHKSNKVLIIKTIHSLFHQISKRHTCFFITNKNIFKKHTFFS